MRYRYVSILRGFLNVISSCSFSISLAPDKHNLSVSRLRKLNHWRSPNFHAFLPIASSIPALLGDMLAGAIAAPPVTWIANPAGTELEMSMMDWLAKMLQLPQEFLFSSGGKGGGCIQASADDAILVAILSARAKVIQLFKDMTKGQVLDKLIAYTSEEAHSSVEKAAQLALVQIRCLETDEKFALRGTTLAAAVREDRKQGLIPFFVCATVGTTSTCAIDNISELGLVCEAEDLWLHIDAVYAGTACICPEYRHWINGVEYSTTFSVNPHKWLHINPPCSAFWVKDRDLITEPLDVDAMYLRDRSTNGGVRMPEFRDIAMAKEFEALVLADPRFEIVGNVVSGLVCFRLKGDNALNKKLLAMIDKSRRICITPSISRGIFYLRFCISVCTTESRDVVFAWEVIRHEADVLLSS
ncbi:Aromatic-l-amino-acid decarboxylase [Plakobranchus ocellatus]|uniref:Aromatic-L-amino-acid decarboxylase n=1 Tax=Plakobranchus ocellatus TaxID=259542 RepID=A0AAV4DR49_9GAST|nr:Aromatic-l-amino-acid decarboxylase [Plakobranchus ocellatus]